MSTAYVCSGCGKVTEYYEDPGPYVEHGDGPCVDCEQGAANKAFDQGFAAVEARAYDDDPLDWRD